MKIKALFIFLFFVGLLNLSAQKPLFNVQADSAKVKLGQPFRMHFSLSNPQNLELKYPDFLDSIDAHFFILKDLPKDTTDKNITMHYEVAAYEFGTFQVGPFPFAYEENGLYVNDSSNSIFIEVYAPEVDTTKAFMDIYGPVDMPFSWREWIKPFSYILLGILALLLIAYFIWKKRKAYLLAKSNRPTFVPPPIDPYLEALKEWNRLKENNAAAEWDAKLYYTELTDILRLYFERKLGFNAPEMTSDEILSALEYSKTDKTIVDLTRSILHHADLAKFAKTTPDTGLRQLDFDKSLLIVEKIQQKLKEGGLPE